MNREYKTKPTFEIETVDQWMARTKKTPTIVNFDKAYKESIANFIKRFTPGTGEHKRHAERMIALRKKKNEQHKTRGLSAI